MCPRRRLSLPRSQPYKTSCLHPKDDGEGEEMDRTMSIRAAFALVILPPDCEMTLLVSELALATLPMRGAVEQGGSLSVCLSICVQRAALKTPPPFGRTLSFPKSATRLSRGADSLPQASWGPFPQIPSSRRGSGSHGTPVGQACTADSGQTKRNGAKHHVQQSHPHRPPRTERRSQNRSEQQRVRHPQHRNPGKLEERQGRIREPHRVAPRLRLEESLEVRQDSSKGATRHPGRHSPVSRGRG